MPHVNELSNNIILIQEDKKIAIAANKLVIMKYMYQLVISYTHAHTLPWFI